MKSHGLAIFALTGIATLAIAVGCETTQMRSGTPEKTAIEYPLGGGSKDPAPAKPTPRTGWPTHTGPGCYALAYPTGDARTSALGIEKCVPTQVRLGQAFDSMIYITNLTSNELSDVVVTDMPSNNLKINSSTPQGQASANGMTWNLGVLGPHETKTITVNGTAGAEGNVSNCVTASYNTALCATIPVVSPKLRVTKTGPAEVLRCDPINYVIEVSNTGTGTINDVKVTDNLPEGLRTAQGQNSFTANVGTLAAGQSKRVSLPVQASRTGSFTNKALASGAGLDVESETVTTVVKAPVLKIDKTCPGQEFIGRTLDYSITVSNTGNGDARNTVLEDTMPAGAEFVSASDGGRLVGNKVVWELGTLAPDASKKVSLSVRANTAGTYTNSAMARAACAEPVSDSCDTPVTGIPAILLEVIDLDDPIAVGNNETYRITVTNQGSAPDTNIKIVCELEDNQEYVSSRGATTGTGRGQTVTFAPIPSLGAKQQAQFEVTVRCVEPGDVRFTVIMTSNQLTRPVQETEATNVYE